MRPSYIDAILTTFNAPPLLREYIDKLETQVATYEAEMGRPSAGLERHGDNALGHFASENETSRKAALDNYPRSGSQRHRCLVHLVMHGLRGATSDEIAEALDMRLYSVKPRLIELREGGWAERDGRTRPSATGSDVEVYVATQKGRDAVLTRGDHETRVAV